jgi:molybdate transport system substrate-binding protein
MDLRILSAGAAKGIVQALQQEFLLASGAGAQGTFGAVGMIREKLLANEPCDVIILTAAMIEELTQAGHVLAGSSAPLGRVRTGVAVRTGEPLPDISNRDSLKASLLSCDGIYFPDPERATAGIHFVNVLKRLGIHEQLASKLRPYPNGATAMLKLAQTTEPALIGCTQITEIKYTEGVTLVGLLPEEFELSTVYSIAVCSKAAEAEIARRFVELLAGEKSQALRAEAGFEF